MNHSFGNVKLNVVQYMEPCKMGSDRSLLLDDSVARMISKYNLGKSVSLFEGNFGCYVCTSAVQEPFVSNPFNMDVEAISSVSSLICDVLREEELNVSGWRIYDDQKGKFRFEVCACDWDYDSVSDQIAPIVFNSDTLKVSNSQVVKSFYGSEASVIVRGILNVIKSLKGIDMPIDLIEVCLFGAKYSEESYDEEDEETCVWDEMGNFYNTTHVVEGLSVIHKENGFEDTGLPGGKYAMVVVL